MDINTELSPLSEYSQAELFVYGFIAFNILLAVAMSVSTLVIIAIHRATIRRNAKLENIFLNYLSIYLINGIDENVAVGKFRRLLFFPGAKQKLINLLIRATKNINGDAQNRVRTLYISLELDKYSFEKLNSLKLYRRLAGMKELTELSTGLSFKLLNKYFNESNDQIHLQAEASMVKNGFHNVLDLVDRQDSEFGSWEQIMLHEIFSHYKRTELPDFSKWIFSKKEKLAVFSIRMMAIFNQFEKAGKLKRLIESENVNVRIAAIQAAGDLFLIDSLERLKERFYDECEDCKIEIIRTLGKLGGTAEIAFMRKQMFSGEFKIQLEAFKALKVMNKDNFQKFGKEKELTPQILNIVAHVMDERI